MEKSLKLQLLETIGRVYEKAKDSKLNNSYFKSVDKDLIFLSEYFHTDKIQAFFTSIIFALNYKDDYVDIYDMTKCFECNAMKILEYSHVLDELIELGILIKTKSRHRMNLSRSNDQFSINKLVTSAVLDGKSMPETKGKKQEDIYSLLQKISSLADENDDDGIYFQDMIIRFSELIDSNVQYPLIEKLIEFELCSDELLIYCYVIWNSILESKSLDLNKILSKIYPDISLQLSKSQQFLNEKHPLIKQDLVSLEEGHFYNDFNITLTEKSKDILDSCGIKTFIKTKPKKDAILHSDIKFKKLIFDLQEMSQLKTLQNLMKEEKFSEIQKRLNNKKLPSGVNILLHGAPGTGKTEIVNQLARTTKRNIVKVDISNAKSMWYGESQKIVKKIFTDYAKYSKECDNTPILFFNEADALFSIRKDVDASSVQQTENAIQNVILEEIENFNGILIATTNLVTNFDPAFERRFLFKIQFEKPSVSVRTKIWKSKLKNLSIEECKVLAEMYSFSGGQIENIVRKKEIEEIIYGKTVSYELIKKYCDEESFETKTTNSIGFKNN